MLGPPSQSQQYPQYHGHPPSQNQYPSNGIQHDSRSQHPQHPQHPQQTNGHAHAGADMNPYQQQYPAGYGQPQQYSQGQQQQQYPQQQQQQPPQQQSQQQQQQIPQAQRAYAPAPNANQLPPLGHSSMVPTAVTDSHSSQTASPANPPQSQPYMSAPPQQAMAMHQQQPLAPPAPRASVSAASNTPREKKMSHQSSSGKYMYSLEVVQQPQRARMCGFGDKDRRPITPPPCVRLVITDVDTGHEVNLNDVPHDPSFFLLQCDLWAESADREANVVRASSNSPAVSISSATTTSYPPPLETGTRFGGHDPPGVYLNQEGQPVYSTVPGYALPVSRPGMPNNFGMAAGYPGGNMYYQGMGPQMTYMPPQQNNAMYTRNLIGSLTVNAAKLVDDQNKPGYWFVLQDLSVRTEGFFRLRMSFVDISSATEPGNVNRGATPVLAWTFSDKFQVYSAKKFPGVIESTPLSKAFAGQGIKIPIRKDNKNDAADDDDGD